MMFNGSAQFAPKQFDKIMEFGGGYSNAFTNSDTTEYFEEFSSGTLDNVVQMEADRMRALKLDKANIEQERGIVKEERRVNTDNNVDSAMAEVMVNSAFVAHPYHWDTIGFMKDIDAIRLEDAKEYFRLHYAPNNAVVCRRRRFRHQNPVRQSDASITATSSAQPHAAPRRQCGAAADGRTAYRVPQGGGTACRADRLSCAARVHDADDPALDMLAAILSHGESSRLYRRLVYEKQIATSVSADNNSRQDPGLFLFAAQAQQGHTAQECEDAIYDVLAGVQKDGVTAGEMQKAKNVERVGFLDRFKTNNGRAGLLAEYEALWGGWQKLYDYLPPPRPSHCRRRAARVQASISATATAPS